MARRKKSKPNTEEVPRNPNGTPKVRPVSRNGGFNKLRALTCFPEVHDRICKGWPLGQVATYVQEECGEYQDAAHSTLVKVLQNYRDSLPSGERAKYALPKAHQEAIAQVEKDIDEVQEMIATYREQQDRVKIDLEVEKNIGKLLPTMTQEMRVKMEMLKTIANLKMDLGMYERKLGTVDIEANLIADVEEKYEGTDVSKVLTDPKKRRRLLNIAEHALSLSKRGVEVELDEDQVLEPEGELVASDD